MKEMDRLTEIIRRLRGENGCPWDREQTLQTMTDNLLEEAYEVVEAIDHNSTEDIKEELGDLMFLTVFLSYIAEQEGRFEVADVVCGVGDKLIRRHPHVFGETDVKNVDEVLQKWEAIKQSEKKNENRKTIFDGIPKRLPELQKYNKVLEKVRRADGNIEAVMSEETEEALKWREMMDGMSEAQMKEFVRFMLTDCFEKKTDLSAIIRGLSIETMQNYSDRGKNTREN